MNLIEALIDYLRDDLTTNDHGRLYEAAGLAKALSQRGLPITADQVCQALRQNSVTVGYRGGYSNVPVTFDKPNRQATLRQVDKTVFSLDTELAIQRGLQVWFHRAGYIARQEVSDSDPVISGIAGAASIEHLPDSPDTRDTRSRDLMAHAPQRPVRTFHVVEVKGYTQVESDFYETFGQVFPIADADVTRGWTIKKVPKHGLCLKYARRFLADWSADDSQTLITLVVGVPDFPPASHNPTTFYDGPTEYYLKQANMYARFLHDHDIQGDHVFARLLRHLRDEYGLLDMVKAAKGIGFRLWGYQGLNWVRDFATNRPAELSSGTGER